MTVTWLPAKNSTAETTALVAQATDLQSKMETYYQTLNQQLDKHLKNRPRDPFNNPYQNSTDLSFKPQSKLNSTPAAPTTANAPVFKRRSNAGLPNMSFKGMIVVNNEKQALLEIEGVGTFVVKEQDKVGLQQVNSTGAVLHVIQINELNLIMETGSFSEKLVVQ
ncbi:hypothetical protein DV711_16770 [Motiliproteus coralliicola]|uniref:Uncharacterized protein n=1 Tax=Motiliproteus coralliicola TaxID=2283196 RepID=A0A369WAH4_9GAMM|nr:hypothetical protein [Motiliproteus coralliicola]RDE18313.1 hypothetical protein DV711_16770 [Motiliproteus coralliicola]